MQNEFYTIVSYTSTKLKNLLNYRGILPMSNFMAKFRVATEKFSAY